MVSVVEIVERPAEDSFLIGVNLVDLYFVEHFNDYVQQVPLIVTIINVNNLTILMRKM